MGRIEKQKRKLIEESNKRMLNEQEEIIDGYTCKDSDGYVVCSKKDKWGYVIRVFKSPIESGKLPNESEFQAGGKTWEETLITFNKKIKEKGLNLQPPTVQINQRKVINNPTYKIFKPLYNIGVFLCNKTYNNTTVYCS